MSRPIAVKIDGAKLQTAREQRGLTQIQVAEKVPCNETTVRNAERTNRTSSDTLSKIVRAINELNAGKPNRCMKLVIEDFMIDQESKAIAATSNSVGENNAVSADNAIQAPAMENGTHDAPDPVRTAEFDEATLQETYARTADEIEKLLAGNRTLCEFLLSACPQAIRRSAKGVAVSEDVRSGRIDMCVVLKSIKTNLPGFTTSPADRKRLLEIVGGLFVFAVNPRWVLEQRASMREKDIVFSGRRETVPFKQGQSAALLPLLIAALADGFAHLEKILGKPSARQLTVDPPKVGRGILKKDKRTELQLHFIDYLLKPGVDVDRNDPDDIAEAFDRTCEMLTYAFDEEKEPYFTSNRSYSALSTIIREDLKMKHLLLIFPDGKGKGDGKEKDHTLITDPVFLFSHASEIFQSLTDTLTAP